MEQFLTNGIPAIITAIGVIIMGYWKATQRNRDKMADLKIEDWKRQQKETNYRAIENAARIYGILWEILYTTKCYRVYILQPHPTHNHQFVTITLEVKRKGISGMKNQVVDMPMGEIAHFVRELVSNDWIYYENINQLDIDKKVKSVMGINGTTQVAIHKLVNVKNDWVGSLFVESANELFFDPDDAKKKMEDAGTSIQYILPEYKG